MFLFTGMAFSSKGKARRVFQSQPIGQALFSRPLSMQRPWPSSPALVKKKWTHACASSCWFGGTTSYMAVYW